MQIIHDLSEEPKIPTQKLMASISTIAVEGCCHGDLDRIYEVIAKSETEEGLKTDFMICCGDFQAIRTTYEPYLL
jgi:hypothetical protein